MAGSLLPHRHGLSLTKDMCLALPVWVCVSCTTVGPACLGALARNPCAGLLWHQDRVSLVGHFFEVMLELLNNARVWGVLTKWEINILYYIEAKVTIKWIELFSRGKNVPLDILCHILEKYLSLISGKNYFKMKKWNFVAQLRIKKVNPLGFLLFGWIFLWQFWFNFTSSSARPRSAFSANAVLCNVLSTPNW